MADEQSNPPAVISPAQSPGTPALAPDVLRVELGDWNETWGDYWVDIDLNRFTWEALDRHTGRERLEAFFSIGEYFDASNLPYGHTVEGIRRLPMRLTTWLANIVGEQFYPPKADSENSPSGVLGDPTSQVDPRDIDLYNRALLCQAFPAYTPETARFAPVSHYRAMGLMRSATLWGSHGSRPTPDAGAAAIAKGELSRNDF